MNLVNKNLSILRTKKQFPSIYFLKLIWTYLIVSIICSKLFINAAIIQVATATTTATSITTNFVDYYLNKPNFLLIQLPENNSIKIILNESDNYDVNNNFLISTNLIIKPTLSLNKCNPSNPPLTILNKTNADIIISLKNLNFFDEQIIYTTTNNNNNNNNNKFNVTKSNAVYLCYFDNNNNKLNHMGIKSKFDVNSSFFRGKRQSSEFRTVINDSPTITPNAINVSINNSALGLLRIDGYRIESSDREPSYSDDGVPEFRIGTSVIIRIFGAGITEKTIITFTEESHSRGGSCLIPATGQFSVTKGSVYGDSIALVEFKVPIAKSYLYMCARYAESDASLHLANETSPFFHQGTQPWLRLTSYQEMIPLWLSLIIITLCLMFSALFSGLNLGLMSLDRTELKILKNTGTPKERIYAAKIQPVRDHGNFLLCSILLGNVLVNSTFTIILDGLTSGLIAVVFSTLLIVVFGEITPQAVCSRHGLAVGANTIYITKVIMIITFPLAYPVSKLLDFILGEEIGNVYNRERLKELVRVTKDVNDLDKDEVNIISGALELRKKTVADVMTHIEDAFMLTYDAILDFETVSEIMKSGFSRIPVYENERKNVLTLLFIKDLAFVDPDDNTPLRTLCEFYQNPCHFVFEDVTLDVMFRRFKEGHKGHMAFVHRVNSEGDGDPFYETVGLITLEDVIEELIQAEIMDETDVYTDNRTKVRRIRSNQKQDFTLFAIEKRDLHRIHISPQLTLATFQYLSASVDAFKPDLVSETILRRLLNQDIIHHIKCKGKEKSDPSMIIYQQGKPVDYFVLILEGRVEVTVGRENLMFESGPFTYFGTQALAQNVVVADSPQQIKGSLQSLNMDALLRHTFVPDYSVKALTDVFYIALKRTLYLAAKRATLMERARKSGEPASNEPIDEEVEKLLHSLDEDDRSITAHTVTLNTNTPKTSKPSSNSPSPVMFIDAALNGPATTSTVSIVPGNPIVYAGNVNKPQGRSYSIPLPFQFSKGENADSPLLKRPQP